MTLISIVIVMAVHFVMKEMPSTGPMVTDPGLLPLAIIWGSGRTVTPAGADIVFWRTETGMLGMAVLVGASFAGVPGAIVGAGWATA